MTYSLHNTNPPPPPPPFTLLHPHSLTLSLSPLVLFQARNAWYRKNVWCHKNTWCHKECMVLHGQVSVSCPAQCQCPAQLSVSDLTAIRLYDTPNEPQLLQVIIKSLSIQQTVNILRGGKIKFSTNIPNNLMLKINLKKQLKILSGLFQSQL